MSLAAFLRMVEPELNSGCWLWAGGATRDGYGVAQHRKRSLLAHRVAWELFTGTSPDGKLVCHRCDTPACVNPDHLFLGTQAENMADMKRKGRADRKFGQRNGRAVLTDETAREVLDVLSLNYFGQRAVARAYGISDSTISRLRHRESFPHVWPYEVKGEPR